MTPAEIFEAHCENERRRRYANIRQTERDECIYIDNALLVQLIDLEDADADASSYLSRWADEVARPDRPIRVKYDPSSPS